MNPGYHPDVVAQWQADGCLDTISRRLGYRFTLVEVSVVEAIRPGGLLDLDVQLRNDGFASMYNRRPVYVVLEGDSATFARELTNVDLRRFEAGETNSITVRARLPESAPTGTYRLALWLPDDATRLRGETAYAVRLANEGVWDAATGFNVLARSIRVTADAPVHADPTAPELIKW
jgi:hypothetical protein